MANCDAAAPPPTPTPPPPPPAPARPMDDTSSRRMRCSGTGARPAATGRPSSGGGGGGGGRRRRSARRRRRHPLRRRRWPARRRRAARRRRRRRPWPAARAGADAGAELLRRRQARLVHVVDRCLDHHKVVPIDEEVRLPVGLRRLRLGLLLRLALADKGGVLLDAREGAQLVRAVLLEPLERRVGRLEALRVHLRQVGEVTKQVVRRLEEAKLRVVGLALGEAGEEAAAAAGDELRRQLDHLQIERLAPSGFATVYSGGVGSTGVTVSCAPRSRRRGLLWGPLRQRRRPSAAGADRLRQLRRSEVAAATSSATLLR